MTDSNVTRETCDDQRATIAFLERPLAYGAGVTTVERIDTHASIVFLAGTRAYKLKRAVVFSYLDFSTVALREASVRDELAINGRTAPEIYRAVRSIARAGDGSVAFDGPGEVLDWVVEMERFDEAALFDSLCSQGKLDDRTIVALGAEIATFHASAERTPTFGGRASIEREIAGIERNLALASEDVFPEARRIELARRWRTEAERYRALLDRRDRDGNVRHCHGDLHLRNIVMWHDRPTLFDAIDFNANLACIDVLYDLAFLAMDLAHRDRNHFANLVTNAYLDRTDQADGLPLLPLFISLRAAIRAHTGVAGARTLAEPGARTTAIAEARTYFALAERSLRERAPRLVAIGGPSGSGKSTLARALGHDLGRVPGARVLHTDDIRKRFFHVASTERLGAEAYSRAIGERVYRAQREEAVALLRAGVSVIVDGVFLHEAERAAIAAAARACGATFTGLWLGADARTLRARVAARTGDASDATVTVLEGQLRELVANLDWIEIDSGDAAQTTLEHARAILGRATEDAELTAAGAGPRARR